MSFFSKYFFRGLLFVTPVGVTLLIMLSVYDMVNEAYEHSSFKNLGLILFIIIVVTILIGVGYLGSTLFIRPLLNFFDRLITRIPLIGMVYSSLKDILSALVGEEKKFDKPVLVTLGEGVFKIGFLTIEDLKEIGLTDLVSVYLPHSYNFSGNHLIVHKSNIQILNLPKAELMKLVVSGGVAGYDEIIKKMETKKPPFK